MSNGTNDNMILLDLNKVDFESDISGDNIWQKDAVNEFTRFLSTTALQAQKREQDRKEGEPTIIHDAIFIGGARGTGKTVFLQNIKGFWNNSTEKESTKLKLHFCKSIDPTLLVNHDDFTNVVIAHLYNEVESHIEKLCCDDGRYEEFYHALKNVCNALGKQENLGEGIGGLDRVIKYRSGIKLIQLFETFLRSSIKILGVAAIILPIDDIDMALERSHEVLDVVRRMLASHLIIPVITGDLELYEPIITHRFLKGDSPLMRGSMIDEEQAQGLTNAYLTKVLPHQSRISLEPIKRLLPDLKILPIGKIIGEYKDTNKLDSYPEFANRLEATLFGPLNGEEKSCDWPKPSSAREVTQLIRDLSPENLTLLSQNELWLRYKSWAYLKQDDVAYSTAVSCHQIHDLRRFNDDFVTLKKLHSFNPIQQMNDITPKFNGKSFFAEQLITHNFDKTTQLGEDMAAHLEELKHVEIYRSMPPVEIFSNEISVAQRNVSAVLKDGNENKTERILLDVFTFNNYYDRTLKTKRQVFFSRAFDILSSSLLNNQSSQFIQVNGTINLIKPRVSYWKKVLTDILKTAPFYSLPAIFPTKAFNVDADLDENQEEKLNTFDNHTVNTLANRIAQWEREYADALRHYPAVSLNSLVYAVFNKAFTQLKIFREEFKTKQFKKENDKRECLSDLALRFKYIVLNSFATLIKPAPVVLQNVALTGNVDIIRDFKSHRSVSPPIRDNIGYFFAFDEDPLKGIFSSLKERNDMHKSKLIQAIANHPLFILLEDSTFSNGLFSIFDNRIKLSLRVLTTSQMEKILSLKSQGRKLTITHHRWLFGINEAEVAEWE